MRATRYKSNLALTVGACLLVGVLTSTLAGCAPATPTSGTVSAEQFWQSTDPGSAEEVNPATSLEELEARSSVIVRASVESVSAGPVDIDVQPEGEIKRTSTVLTLKVVDVVAGTTTDPLKVWLSAEYPGDGAAVLPDGESLWFLKKSDQPGLMLMTALSGVIGEGSDGELQTLRDPAQTEAVIPSDATSVEDVEQDLD